MTYTRELDGWARASLWLRIARLASWLSGEGGLLSARLIRERAGLTQAAAISLVTPPPGEESLQETGRPEAERLAPHLDEGAAVLDPGIGLERAAQFVVARIRQLWGVDMPWFMLRRPRGRLRSLGNIRPVRREVCPLQLPCNYFDVAFLCPSTLRVTMPCSYWQALCLGRFFPPVFGPRQPRCRCGRQAMPIAAICGLRLPSVPEHVPRPGLLFKMSGVEGHPGGRGTSRAVSPSSATASSLYGSQEGRECRW